MRAALAALWRSFTQTGRAVFKTLLALPFRAVKATLSWLFALLILFEEWGWEPLQRMLARIGQLPGFRWFERRVSALPPYAALAIFLLPTLLLLPLKLLALWLIGQHKVLLGTLVIVGAKLAGTAIVARLFTLTRPALMQLPWFARLYGRWSAWKEALLVRVRGSWTWRQGQRIKARIRAQLHAWKARLGG